MGEKIIGILGGMGPEASADLYMRIIRATKVEKDQDHFRVIIDSNAKVPDRTPAILGTGPSPLPVLLETGLNLQRAGADFIIMPCNTAHHFIEELRKGLKIPVLHMIRLSAEYIHRIYPDVKKAGLLASDGTLVSKLYDDAYGEQGIEIITPSETSQRDVMEAIYTYIKRGDLETGGEILHRVAGELIEAGADAVLCGCTEVSLVLHDGDLPVPVVDPLQVLAEEAVRQAAD
ncbi:MAG: amino acid racemase [Candidatus Bathyarchaeota archaeon]|nr:amino acid racemase [Candidatus Bathyarchaeota archaeon]